MIDALVIGAGPAGLCAAEALAAGGRRVRVCDRMPSAGRKFLVAGRGGLNLTHGEPVENFPARYGGGADAARWRELLADFGPAELRAWAASLGVETYVGTSGRVFPRGQQAAQLLRAWRMRLDELGVAWAFCWQLAALECDPAGGWLARGADGVEFPAPAVVLALGGASWPQTGSDGAWPPVLAMHGLHMVPWQPANCGWEVAWPPELLAAVEGAPLKNVAARVPPATTWERGELLITRDGLEGGLIYRLGPALRVAKERVVLEIDLKPDADAPSLQRRLESAGRSPEAHARVLRLSPAAAALLHWIAPLASNAPSDEWIHVVKNLRVSLLRPRPIAEAISSAGGLTWEELDDGLMLRRMPGVFAAGEMLDWEAPTGGYLLQGCFATGERAARGAEAYLRACAVASPAR